MKKFSKLVLALMLSLMGLAYYGCKPEPVPYYPVVDPGSSGTADKPGTGEKDEPDTPETPDEPTPGPTDPDQPANAYDGSGIWMDLVRATTSTISVAWTTEEKNAEYLSSCLPSSSYDPTNDITKQYKVAIYSDEACKNLIVAWTINPGLTSASTASFTADYPSRFCFSGLQPATTYYIMVNNLTDKTARVKPFAVKTADKFEVPVVTSSAKAGDILVSESFDGLMYGGDLTTFSHGYSRVDRGSLTTPMIPSGDDPDKTDSQYYTVIASTEMGLFSTMKGLLDEYGLTEWSMIPGGTNMGTILERPGFLKVGANSQHGYIVTPVLSAITEAATVEVSFKAAPYGGTSIDESEKAMRVQVFDGGTIGDSNVLDGALNGANADLTLQGDRGDWKTYTVQLDDVTSVSRIGFGGIGPAAQSRFNIDDIQVKVVSTYPKKASGYYAEGRITYSDGKPASGISVSDGFRVAVTDADGKYYLTTSKDTWYIYFSYPSDAKITTSNGCPSFFSSYSESRHTYNFTLERITPETDFMLFAMADPQAHYAKRSPQTIADTDRFKQEAVPAINAEIASQSLPCYGVTLGDIVYSENSRNSNPGLTTMRGHFAGINMPVFQTMGNHDYYYFYKTANELKTDSRSSTLYLKAQRKFEETFGPVNFSFNRGNVHIVCMRDINYDSTTDAGSYHGGFNSDQYNWLKADLANVPKSKKVILCVHIPICGITSKENVSAVLSLLKQYTEATIFSGHTHYKRSYSNVGSSGLFEHIHAAVCGQWWWSNVEGDGCPNGYTVYKISGTTIKDEYFLGFNNHMNTRDYQMRVYRGNIKTGGANVYFQWPYDKNVLLINVFNGDSRWKVDVYEDGVKTGSASLMANSKQTFNTTKGQTYTVSTSSNQDWWAIGYNMGVVGRGIGSTSYQTNEFHMFKYTLKNASAKVEVRATDPYGNVYKCTEVIENGTSYPAYVAVGNH